MTRFVALSFGTALVAGLAGCGSTPEGNSAGTTTAKEALGDLASLLRAAADEKKRPPAKPADLVPYESGFVFATSAIQQKRIVYVWSAGLTGGPAVVGYDANAETDGGLVLLQDGTVKKMSADEFKAAPKAGK